MFVRLLCVLLLLTVAVGPAIPVQAQVQAEAEPAHAEAVQEEDAHAEDAHAAAHGGVDLAWVTFLVFVCLVLVLAFFAWRPLREGLDQRESHVASQLEEAERRNREADDLLKKHQQQLAQASLQVKQMLEEARRSADALREQETARTQEAVQRERNRAVAEINAAKARALEEVAGRAADVAIGLAGRIVRQELRKDDHAALVAQAIDQFPNGK
jgi:F-type H+-transporting ATPase subunit b